MASADWDPMMSDYRDPHFNAYMQGVGRDLTDGDGGGTKLFVDNFPVEGGQEGLYNLFSEFGHVVHAMLKPSNRKDGRLSYGFVTMDSAVDAERALTQLNRRPLRSGVQLVIKPALTRDQKLRREESKQREAEFMLHLGRSTFNREDDMMSSVSAFNRSSDLMYEPSIVAAQAEALLRKTGQAYDLHKYIGRGHSCQMGGKRHFGRGRAQSFRDSYLLGMRQDFPNPIFGGRGRGGGRDAVEQPRPGSGSSHRPLNFGRGSTQRLTQPRRPAAENLKICIKCGVEGSAYRCQACKCYYCSPACQRQDWPRHEKICLDISVHNFSLKYNEPNVMKQNSGGNKPIHNQRHPPPSPPPEDHHHQHPPPHPQSHHHHPPSPPHPHHNHHPPSPPHPQSHQHQNGVGSGHRNFGKANYQSEFEEEDDFHDRSVRQTNRGYESEAGGGKYNNGKKQTKVNGFNKPENRNNHDQFKERSKGRQQERTGGYKGKDEEHGFDAKKQSGKSSFSSSFESHEKDSRPQRPPMQKHEFDRKKNPQTQNQDFDRRKSPQLQKQEFDKKEPPIKFNRKDQGPEQDKRDFKPKPSPGAADSFDFSRAKETGLEKRKAPKRDEDKDYKSEDSRGGNKAMVSANEPVGSGDASCDLATTVMEVGLADKCYVTHYESPSKFWINLSKDVAGFFSISEDFKMLLSDAPNGQVKRVKAGELYCMIDDPLWARVKIVTVNQDGNVTVFFPDVGKQEAVHVSQLFPLDNVMREYPAQAVCCCVGNVTPKGRTWNEKAKCAVEQWLGQVYTREMPFKVLEKRGHTHALRITNEEKESLSDFLVGQGLAEVADKSANLPKLGGDAMSASRMTKPSIMAKDLKRQEDCLKENDKIPVNIMQSNATHSQFVGQVTNSNAKEVLRQITNIIEDLDLDKGTPYSPVKGEVVLAKYSEDNCWYRADVCAMGGDKFQVMFLDYGNGEEVKAKDIRKLEDKRLTTFPALTVRLQLWGIEPEVVAEKVRHIDSQRLRSDYGLDAVSSVIVKSKRGSYLLVDFLSKSNKESLCELLKKDGGAVKPLSRETLPSKASCKVGVCFVESCSSFYVLKEDSVITSSSLTHELNENWNSLLICDKPAVGTLVVTDFEGDLYRGEIKNVMKSEKKCIVFFLDFGNDEEVQMDKLYQLPAWASTEPALAIHCGLDVDSIVLSPDADSKFKIFLNQTALVSLLRKEGDKFVVKMTTDDGADVVELLTMALEAEKSSPSRSPSSATASQPLQPSQSDRIKPDLLPVSEEPAVALITFVHSLCEFYIHSNQGNAEELDELLKLGMIASELPHVRDASVGTLCAAEFQDDKAWYRAKITSLVDGTEKCALKFIDFGNNQVSLKGELRELPDSLSSIRAVAIPCCLKGFEKHLDQVQKQDLDVIHGGVDFEQMKTDISTNSQVKVIVHSHKTGFCIVSLLDSEGNPLLDKYKTVEALKPSPVPSACTDQHASSPDASHPTATLGDIPVSKMTDTKFKVILTSMEGITEFYCQRKEECAMKAGEISKTLQEDLADTSPGRCTPVEGGVYGCLFENNWYRCVVEDVSGNRVGIRYMDWGNKEVRDAADLRPLQPEHLTYPITLMKCRLHGVTLADRIENMSSEVQTYIAMLHSKVMTPDENISLWVEIMEQEEDLYQVCLSIAGNGELVNIAEDLVKVGMCNAVAVLEEDGKETMDKDEDEDEDEETVRRMEELKKEMEALMNKTKKKKK